jgi:CRP/FNR family transcriptional regulator, cyclic AMP receptor protein
VPAQENNDVTRWAPGSLLAQLSAAQQQIVLGLGQPRQYHTGDALLSQGDPSKFVVIIIDGYVKITAVTGDGAESLLAIRTAGDIVGEQAALDLLPRSATARAADAVLGRVVTKQEFDRCLRDHPDIAQALNRAISAKLRLSTQRRIEFRRDTKARLAQVLAELYYGSPGRRRDGNMAVLVTQSELAGLIGASEPAVHKAIRALRDAGAIGTGYGRLVIRDIEVIREIAEGRA